MCCNLLNTIDNGHKRNRLCANILIININEHKKNMISKSTKNP